MTAHERTGIRDLSYSAWHRTLGPNLPACDLDWIEFDRGVPVALLETKHLQAADENIYTASLRAQEKLAEMASLPHFIVRYDVDPPAAMFFIEPRNQWAEQYVDSPCYMDEGEYTRFLHDLRREPHATH